MGAKLSGPSGKGAPVEQNADINVTPFVDVMLVLLIIFMVSAPLATVSIRLDLPPPPPVSTETPPPPTFISIATDGQLYITTGEDVPATVTLEGIDGELLRRLGARDERVLIRADADVMYNDFMTVMNYLQDRGWLQVGLINEDIS